MSLVKNSAKKKAKKMITKVLLVKLLPILVPVLLIFVVLLIISSAMVSGGKNGGGWNGDCGESSSTDSNSGSATVSANASVDEFVKKYEDAYILSWKAGGFLPSASIAQTMVENGFNFTNPSGTSFWKAHNMGGVKTTSKKDFPITLENYGEDSVDVTGTKPGTTVGDGTGGAYTWFKDYDAGIVGKAEFMRNQSLYTGAINNTDGKSALSAIAKGGWATDPNYETTLHATYDRLGVKYKWLDEKAIAAHGSTPIDKSKNAKGTSPGDPSTVDSTSSEESTSNCDSSSSGGATDGTGKVPTDATAWGYKPDDVPDSLKPYIIDPKKYGMDYGGPNGWVEKTGQCVDLSVSLGNKLWGGTGTVIGHGGTQATAWATTRFGNSTKKTPKAGAIFSEPKPNDYGHTGIVCHVFEDGTILIIEQNTIYSGANANSPNTWNYRLISKKEQEDTKLFYAYADDREPIKK